MPDASPFAPAPGVTVPLQWRLHQEKTFPLFPIPRLVTTILVEAADPAQQVSMIEMGVLVDTGSPFCIISHDFQRRGSLRIYQDLGMQPYRLLSMTGQPSLQRFCVIGLRFWVSQPQMAYVPERFLPMKAYLLDATVRPGKGMVLGLDALREHFRTHIEEGNSFLQLRS
jgi:hypothetical protein